MKKRIGIAIFEKNYNYFISLLRGREEKSLVLTIFTSVKILGEKENVFWKVYK